MIKTIVAALAIAIQGATAPSGSLIAAEGTGTSEGVVRTVMVNIYARNLTVGDDEYLTAMRAAGLDHAEVPGLNPGALLGMRGVIANATADKLAAFEHVAQTFVSAHNGILASIIFVGSAAECPAIEAQARVSAIAALRQDAQSKATQAGLKIGAPSTVDESGGCPVPGPIDGAFAIDKATMKMPVTVKENAVFAQAAPVAGEISVRGVGASDAVVHNVKFRMYADGVAATDDEVLRAIHAAGMNDADFGQPGPGIVATTAAGVGRKMMRGSIDNATTERLRSVRQTMQSFVASHHGSVASVIFFGSVAECPAIEAQARAIAIADARRRALSAASTLLSGTELNAGPVAIDETRGCPQGGDLGGAMSINPLTMRMRVSVTENVTYGTLTKISGGSQ